MSDYPSNKPSEHISNMLNSIKKGRKFNAKLMAIEAEEALESIFGNSLKKYLSHVRVSNDVLHIYVNSSTFKHELYQDKVKLLEKINDLLKDGSFEDVQIHG